MHQAFLAGHDLHEGAKVEEAGYFAGVDGAHLYVPGEPLNDLDGAVGHLLTGGANIDGPVVLHVDGALGLLNDGADDATARADDSPDLLGGYLDAIHAGRVAGEFAPAL